MSMIMKKRKYIYFLVNRRILMKHEDACIEIIKYSCNLNIINKSYLGEEKKKRERERWIINWMRFLLFYFYLKKKKLN